MIYARISLDLEGQALGVARQLEDCRALAERLGAEIVAEYVDNDTGASTLSKKPRPQYAAMLEAIHAGGITHLIAYSNSRLTRRPRELEDLLTLHRETGVRVVTVASGEADLGTADGRLIARLLANIDAAEAERTSERTKRRHAQAAQAGKTYRGGRAFGWKEGNLEVDPAEAGLIRAAAADILDGVPLQRITTQWRDAGRLTATGRQWRRSTVQQVMARPRNAGLVIRHGQIVTGPDGRPVQGEWEPILDRETWERVVAVLDAGTAGGRRPGRRKYLLSGGLLRCSVCSRPLHGMATGGTYAYACHRAYAGHAQSINGPAVEAAVVGLVKARLAVLDLNRPADPEPAPDPSQARLTEIAGKITELMAAFNTGQLSGGVVFPAVEQLEAEAAALNRERADRVNDRAGPADVTAADLDRVEDTDRLRAVIESVLVAVPVAPAARTGGRFDPDRLGRPVWRG